MLKPRRLRLTLVLSLLLAVSPSGAHGGTRSVSLPRTRTQGDSVRSAPVGVVNLTGTWEGTVRLDSIWQIAGRASSQSIPARVRFEAAGDAAPTMSSRSVHPGSFEIDFARFGFTLSTRDALGWSIGSDSMHAVLNPAVDHGTVQLSGAFRGETIMGTWRYVTDPGGATGTFQLRRVTARPRTSGARSAPRPVQRARRASWSSLPSRATISGTASTSSIVVRKFTMHARSAN